MNRFTRHAFSICVLILAAASVSMAQKMKPDEIVAKHLESIGTAEVRGSIKSMMTVGDVTVTFVSQKNQAAVGRVVMASSGNRNFIGLQLNAADYPGDMFSFDGSKAKVAKVVNGQRSYLTGFVEGNQSVLKDSLLGGVLASSWVLNDLTTKKGKFSGGGLKKIDGKEYYAVDYSPKGGSDVDITLYFEKDTFRHGRTEYKRTSSAAIGATPNQSAGFDETKLKVTEVFGDFRDEKGLMLPHTYKFIYSEIGQRGTREVEWAYALNEFAFNQPMDDKTFDVEAKSK